MNAKFWLCLLIACLLAAYGGYRRGVTVTSAGYRAQIAEANALRSAEDRARAEAVAASEKSARERLEAAQNHAARLADQLAAHKDTLTRERAAVNRRIADAAQNAALSCPGLPADWVRVYNEALGLAASPARPASPGGGSGGQAGIAPGTSAPAKAPGSPRAGVQQNALTTPEDVLAHVRDYGAYCRTLASQARTLIDWEAR